MVTIETMVIHTSLSLKKKQISQLSNYVAGLTLSQVEQKPIRLLKFT